MEIIVKPGNRKEKPDRNETGTSTDPGQGNSDKKRHEKGYGT